MSFTIEWKLSRNLNELRNLKAKYVLAREKTLPGAMQESVDAVRSSVVGRIPVVSGRTRAGVTSMVNRAPGSVTGKVTTSLRRPFLSPFILNYGRKAGQKTPPSSELEAWVSARGLASGAGIKQVAFLIARSIGKKGTKGIYYQSQSLDEKKSNILDIFQRAVESLVREIESFYR